jgi:hypothetical protein
MTLDLGPLRQRINGIPDYLDRNITALMAYHSGRVSSAAKINAPWTDRTTNARNGLTAGAGKANGVHFIVLAHRVPYGIWLEIRWSGKYSIILPTLQEYAPTVMKGFEKLLDRYGV